MIKRSFLLFLYSTPNMMGCLWGAIGLIAFFAGIIKLYWFFIVLGLYGLGYLISPKTESIQNLHLASNRISTKELKSTLDTLINKISKRLSNAEMEMVKHIQENILALLPRINEMQAAEYDLHVIKQTVTDYLPNMLMTYIELPPMFAKMHKLMNGKTAQENLIEQLTILDDQINQIVININSKDAQALMVQGEFLKSKFTSGEQWI